MNRPGVEWRLLALEIKDGVHAARAAPLASRRRVGIRMRRRRRRCGWSASLRAETGMTHGAVRRVAEQLGYGVESVRTWVKQADIDDGVRPGVTTERVGAGQGARAGGP